MADELLRRREGHIEVLTINRPQARNAIDLPTAISISTALDECETDRGIWVVILTATGDKAFSAGMDLRAFAKGEVPVTDRGFGGITQRYFPKPLICAANGSALAGGFEILLSCDLVVAAEHATFGIVEAQRGLIAGGGGLIRLPRRTTRAAALEMAMCAEPISAQRALELGLVNRVVPLEQVLPTAMLLATRICANAPLAVRTSKKVMISSMTVSEETAWQINAAALTEIVASADAQEGVTAFTQNRKTIWLQP